MVKKLLLCKNTKKLNTSLNVIGEGISLIFFPFFVKIIGKIWLFWTVTIRLRELLSPFLPLLCENRM